MEFSISTLGRIASGPPPEIICADWTWRRGMAELRRRSASHRESGAFLLGSKGSRRQIDEFIYYDDIDPHALDTGIVVIDGRKLGPLWAHCRATGRQVVADVHVHPEGCFQSVSDKANPIIAEVGHIAIIIPDYATRSTRPGQIGVYQYLGSRHWRDRSAERRAPLHLGWWPKWR